MADEHASEYFLILITLHEKVNWVTGFVHTGWYTGIMPVFML